MTGKKDDSNKPMAGLMLRDFSRALLEVSRVSTFGCLKYGTPSGWATVPDAQRRYNDALVRHQLQDAIEPIDQESGLLHKAHACWNCLAVLELELMQKTKETRLVSQQERKE